MLKVLLVNTNWLSIKRNELFILKKHCDENLTKFLMIPLKMDAPKQKSF